MAFSGYLIKLGGSSGVTLPMKYIKVSSYKSTPNQRMEQEAKRAVTGLLHRTTVEHTATKIEFETPYLTNSEQVELIRMIKNVFTNTLERKLTIYYYNEEDDDYKTAEVYMPDIQYTINRIDLSTNIVYYEPFRVCFIEY